MLSMASFSLTILAYMLHCSWEPALITIEDIQNDSEHLLCFHACKWQARVALQLLSKKRHYVTTSATGSGKTFVFWLPKLYENGLTIIVIPLKILGEQLAEESCMAGFNAMNITSETLGDSLALIKVEPDLLKMRDKDVNNAMAGDTYHVILNHHPLPWTHIWLVICWAVDWCWIQETDQLHHYRWGPLHQYLGKVLS